MASRSLAGAPSTSRKTTDAAWSATKTNERVLLQQAYSSDPKYRKYAQQVEKCLNSFDNVHEWADCIAFLKQLLKTFQSYMQFKEIPRKLIVAKRLAQCLNPALPTGVHQRALEVYSHILAVLGMDGLNRDLALWSSGLFPFFEYAATAVKPTLLNLYDTYYLPLQSNLRPIMKSFILALLPGLEEETGEFFEKVLALLDRLSGTVSPSFFFQNIWLVMLTTPSARGTALNFLSRRLPRLHADEDISSIVGRDIGLMIRAFAAALEDDNLLVRRSALDLLLQSMKVDSAALKNAQAEDRTILMRAATGVVLRRDLSLNRRLYTWLLGPAENSAAQLTYFRENSLELLRSTLKDEMFSPSAEYSESRPFKILISLLDKWEIGSPLTEVLVFDAFRAIKKLMESGAAEDIVMTASTLYEAVEPHVIWKQLLTAIISNVTTDDAAELEGIRLTMFVLKTFSSQEEEIQSVHLPIVFSAIIDVLAVQLQGDITLVSLSSTLEGLLLAEEILQHIPRNGLLQRPELTGEVQSTSCLQSPRAFARTFYGITTLPEPSASKGCSDVPLASAFENMIKITLNCALSLSGVSGQAFPLRDVFSQSLLLLSKLVERINASIQASWDPSEWLHAVLATIDHPVANFTMIDRLVTLVVTLHQTNGLENKFSIDKRPVMDSMVNKLLGYLRPHHAAYHVRCVVLIWSLETAVDRPHVESIVARSLTLSHAPRITEAYEAFGILWRLSEDNLLPGFKLKVPMMIVLDTLKNDNPSLRRVGETWMRCSLKSYLRVLDPILHDLLDPSVRWIPTVNQVKGKELQGFVYERAFDLRYLNHLLEVLFSVVRFGGQGFVKVARSTPVRRSPHQGLIKRIEAVGFPDPETTYMEVLVETLLRYLLSEPKPSLGATLQPLNTMIQSTSIDLLQALVSRGDVDSLSIEIVEAAVIGKLFYCIHTSRLDLQNKLLHLLHSVISASLPAPDPNKAKQVSLNRQRPVDGLEEGFHQENAADSTSRTHEVNPLLVQTLVDGIATPINRPVIQHWLDFVLMAVPQFQPALEVVITPLNDCLCRQLLAALEDIRGVSAVEPLSHEDVTSNTNDAEIIMFLNGLERLILLSLSRSSDPNRVEEDTIIGDKSGQEGTSGLLGYVSNVFSSDNTIAPTEDQLTSRSAGYRSLHEGVRVLFRIWAATPWSKPITWSSKDDSLSLIYNRTRMRCRRVLEHLFQVQSAEVFESIIECWNRDVTGLKSEDGAAFELVDVLVSSAQTAVHMVCESISCRIYGASEKNKKQAINPNLSDTILFSFLEQYLRKLEGPLAIQVWNRFLQLVKDVSSSRDFKAQTFFTLRCLSVLADKITQTTAIEDRRIRKELQENFGKLLESCIVHIGRSTDHGNWIRRSTKDVFTANGRDSPAPRDNKLDEKMNESSTSLETPKPVAAPDLVTQISYFIATVALPNLRKFVVESDKVLAVCTNIVYYMVNPSMKGKSRPMDVDDTVIQILTEMSKIPIALKAWRSPIAELLNDNRLFNCHIDAAHPWKPVVKALFDADKTAISELLVKVATAPSTNIFTNREYELLLRSLNVRRLSFVLFSGDKNQFITHLPSIQEKLVDILRNISAPIVQSEVYLCIRVLLCRLSPHSLTSFWPVILTELHRVFEQTMTTLPSDGSEDLQLLFAACKCLDLLLALQTEEFQIHQWIFITDTVDAVYHPDNWIPAAMLDQLADIANSLPVPDGAKEPASIGHTDAELQTTSGERPMRRPLLNSIRQIESIRDLVPFFTHVSLSSYESVYASGGNIDWDGVEKGLMEDMFDGR